jgi:hypothetical protein
LIDLCSIVLCLIALCSIVLGLIALRLTPSAAGCAAIVSRDPRLVQGGAGERDPGEHGAHTG